MAILENCEIYFPKLDPQRPNSKFNKQNPTWECQIRTTSKEQKKIWEQLGLAVKVVDPDDEGPIYYRVNLKKKSIKAEDGQPASPVRVVDGNLQPVDPNSIGNGSVGNIRIFQYEYDDPKGGKGTAHVLMGIQLTHHIKYVPKARDDDFGVTDTVVVEPQEGKKETATADGDF